MDRATAWTGRRPRTRTDTLGDLREGSDIATPAQRWVDAWFRAWVEHDPATLAPAYAPGARHRSHPFRSPGDPQEYAAWAFADEAAVEAWFAEPSAETTAGAACEWWAISHDRAGAAVGQLPLSQRRRGFCGPPGSG